MADRNAKKHLTRRDFLRMSSITAVGLAAAACVPAAPAPAQPSEPAAEQPAAPAVVTSPSVAKNDFEAQFEEMGRQFKDVTLHFPVGGEGFWTLCETVIAPRFTELTGIKTQWEQTNYEQVYEKTFLDLGAKSGTYDVFDLNFTWFGQFMATEGLEFLEPYLADPKFPKIDTNMWSPNILDTYGMWEGKIYGLPWLGDAMIFPYNKQHFTEAGLDPEKPPTTWDEVYEFGKQLTQGDRYGFALMGGRQIQAMCTYAGIFFGLAQQPFYQDNGTSSFDSPEGLEAMEIIATRLPEIAPAAATTWDIVAASEAVAQGTCSMEIQWPGILQSLVDPNAPVAGQMGYAAPPGGTALGGHGIGISHYSQNKDAAYLFATYIVAPEIQREYVEEGYAITAKDLFNDPEVQKVNPYIKAFGDALGVGIGWPKTEETPQVFDIMVKYINSAITKQMTPQEALDTMNTEINALREEKGYIS